MYVYICLVMSNLYPGPIYVWRLYVMWSSLDLCLDLYMWYLVGVCMEDVIYYFYKSCGFAQCDTYYMSNSGFFKLFKLYLFISISAIQFYWHFYCWTGCDSLNTLEMVSPTCKLLGKVLTVGKGITVGIGATFGYAKSVGDSFKCR